jgi:hypothetical protein
MTRDKTKTPGETPTPRKKLSLKKKTIRDLETRGRAKDVKAGAGSSTGGYAGTSR